jgi:hypothetical protein
MATGFSTVVEHFPRQPKVKGSCPVNVTDTAREKLVIYKVRVFVFDRPFQPGLMFEGKPRSFPRNVAPERHNKLKCLPLARFFRPV